MIDEVALEQLAVFQGFSPEQLAVLRPLFTLYYVPEGTALFEQGDPADSIYILADGEAAIRYKPEDGPPLVIVRIRSEGVIGWSAAIGSPQYSSAAICTTDCKILRVSSQTLRQLYENDPTTGAMFLERLATMIEARLRSNHPQLMALLEQGLSVKVVDQMHSG